jgi:hypothetical protein
VSQLPNLSLAVLERVFPRSFLAMREAEKSRLARELAVTGSRNDLEKFPEWLDARKWGEGRGFLPDLARLELCLRQAGVAAEMPNEGFDRVANAGEPDWYGARFRFDPGFHILESDWPLEAIFADPEAVYERSPGVFLVCRLGGKPLFRAIGNNEHELLRTLSLGVPLGRVLEKNNGPDLDARTLHRWMESGLLRAIYWAM